MKGFVYVVGNSIASKIGFSESPIKRVEAIKATRFNGVDCESFISRESLMARSWEANTHTLLNDKLIGSEMFSVSFSDAVNAVEKAKPLNSDIEKQKLIKGNLSMTKINAVSLINNVETMRIDGVVMGSMTQFWSALNIARVKSGKGNANLANFLKSGRTAEFAEMVKRKSGHEAVVVTGNGSTSRTWADITMLVYAAEQVSPEFHFQVISAFIDGAINSYEYALPVTSHNIGFDLLSALNNVDGSDCEEVSLLIMRSTNKSISEWGDASYEDLKKKHKKEKTIVSVIKQGFVANYEHLKELISKL